MAVRNRTDYNSMRFSERNLGNDWMHFSLITSLVNNFNTMKFPGGFCIKYPGIINFTPNITYHWASGGRASAAAAAAHSRWPPSTRTSCCCWTGWAAAGRCRVNRPWLLGWISTYWTGKWCIGRQDRVAIRTTGVVPAHDDTCRCLAEPGWERRVWERERKSSISGSVEQRRTSHRKWSLERVGGVQGCLTTGGVAYLVSDIRALSLSFQVTFHVVSLMQA